MARPKEPIELIVAKGNKHIGKAEIEERKKTELKVPVGDIKPPNYLPKELKNEFKEIAGKLMAINIMTELDIDLLARYLLSKQTYLLINIKMVEAINTDNKEMGSLATVQDKAFKQCQSAARDLGLTILSRRKLVIPLKEEPKELSSMALFMKNREK